MMSDKQLHSFDDVFGHEKVIERLKKMINNPSHAYIFEGEKGSGRFLVSKIFAHSLHCNVIPCGRCPHCLKHLSGEHPDFHVLSLSQKNSIGVDDIRELIKEIGFVPSVAAVKFFVIQNAEKMTVQAQNALLKVLEEPPSYAILILITSDATALLSTIRSRAVLLSFLPQRDRVVQRFLVERHPEKADFIPLVVNLANGNISSALSFIEDEDFLTVRNDLYTCLASFSSSKISIIYSIIDIFEKDKGDVCNRLIISWLRDAIMSKISMEKILINRDWQEQISKFAEKTHIIGILNFITILSDYMQNIKVGHNKNLWLTSLFLRGWEELNDNNSRGKI